MILVEGGEKHLLPLIADLERKDGQTANPLDQNNISVVGVGGKSKFREYIFLLKSLEIPYYVIADLDMLEGNGKELLEMKDHTWTIEDIPRDEILQELAKIIKEQASPNVTSIKEGLLSPSSRDGQRMYNVLEHACESGEITDDLKELWEYIKSRHQKRRINLKECKINFNGKDINGKDINGKDINGKDTISISAQEVMDKLFVEEHIYILPKGELEDYFLPEAQKLKQSGKEVTARGIADKVRAERYTTQKNTIKEYLEVSDYKKVILGAIDECQGSKDK